MKNKNYWFLPIVFVLIAGFGFKVFASNLNWIDSGSDSYILGNVGIGTASPSTSLDIVSNASGIDLVHIQNTSTGDAYASIGFVNPAGGAVGGFGYAVPTASSFTDSIYFYSAGRNIDFSRDIGVTNNLQIDGATGSIIANSDVFLNTGPLLGCAALATDVTGKIICDTGGGGGGSSGTVDIPTVDLFMGIVLFYISAFFVMYIFKKRV